MRTEIAASRRAVAGLTIAAAAIGIAGCGGASGTASRSGASSASAMIVRAADVSESASGDKLRMSILETIPGSGTADVRISGAFSRATDSGTATFTMQYAGKTISEPEIIIGPTVYVKESPAVAAKLPGQRPWLELDLSKVGKGSYLSDLSSLTESRWENDPASFLGYLKGESTSVENLGQTTVDGVPATHLGATIDLDKAGDGAPSSVHAALQGLLRKLPGEILNKTDVPVEVWIDAAHRVREMTMTIEVIPKGTTETITEAIKLLISSYGPQATPAPPPPSETTNLLTLLKAEGKSDLLSGS